MTPRISLLLCVLAATGWSVSGCGGSSYHPPESCLKAVPCGGDVVGTWNFLGGCTDLAATNADSQLSCPGASIAALVVTFSGSVTFNTDLTYTTSSWHETFSASESIPLTCVGAPSCSSLSQTTRDATSSAVISCSGSALCSCRLSGSLSVAADTGTYQTYLNALNLFGPATAGSFDYCVEGNNLHLMQLSATSGAVLTDLVAQRATP